MGFMNGGDIEWWHIGLASCSGGRMHPDGVYLMDGFPYKEEDIEILWHHMRETVKPGLRIIQPVHTSVIDSHTLSFEYCAEFSLALNVVSWGGVTDLKMCGTQTL